MWRQIGVSFLKHCPQMYIGSSENNHLGRVNPLSRLVTPPPPPPKKKKKKKKTQQKTKRHYTHDVRQLNSPIYTFNTFYESPSNNGIRPCQANVQIITDDLDYCWYLDFCWHINILTYHSNYLDRNHVGSASLELHSSTYIEKR